VAMDFSDEDWDTEAEKSPRGGMLVGWGALRGRERGAPSRAPAPQRRGRRVALLLVKTKNGLWMRRAHEEQQASGMPTSMACL